MAETYPVHIEIKATDNASEVYKKIGSGIKRMAQEVRKSWKEAEPLGLKKSILELGNISGNVLSNMRKMIFSLQGAFAAAGMTIGAGAFIKGIVQAGAKMEEYKASFEALTGSIEEAEEKLKHLIEFAASTPFSTPSVIEAGQQLQAMGLEAEKFIGVIGDAAAAFSRDIKDAAYGFLGALRGETEMLKRWAVEMKQTADEVTFYWKNREGERKSITVKRNREIIASTLAAIWNEMYGGAMKKYEKTFKGMIELLKSWWLEFQQTIAQSGVMDWIKTQLDEVIKKIKELRETGKLQEYAKKISDALIKAGEAMKNTIPHLTEFAKKIWQMRKAILAFGATMVALDLVAKIKHFGDTVLQAIPKIASFVKTLAPLTPVLVAIGGAYAMVHQFQKGYADATKKDVMTVRDGLAILAPEAEKIWYKLQNLKRGIEITAEEWKKYGVQIMWEAERHGYLVNAIDKTNGIIELSIDKIEKFEDAIDEVDKEPFKDLNDEIVKLPQHIEMAVEHANLLAHNLPAAVKRGMATIQDAGKLLEEHTIKILEETEKGMQKVDESLAQQASAALEGMFRDYLNKYGMFIDDFASTLTDLITGIEIYWDQTLGNMLKSWATFITQVKMRQALVKLFSPTSTGSERGSSIVSLIMSLIGAGVGSLVGVPQVGSALGAILGSLLGGFQEGGLVPGNAPYKDRILALLTPGEFVVKREAVASVGLGVMNEINRGRLPQLPSVNYHITINPTFTGLVRAEDGEEAAKTFVAYLKQHLPEVLFDILPSTIKKLIKYRYWDLEGMIKNK